MLQFFKFSLALLMLAGLGHQQNLDLDFCNPDFIVEDPDKLPPPLPGEGSQFEQRVEMNYGMLTEEIFEVYDGPRNFGLTALINSTKKTVYYAIYDTNELLELSDNYTCKVSKLTGAEAFVLPFFPQQTQNGSLHIALILSQFVKTGIIKLKYTGSNQEIRGIPVNEWQGCLASDSSDGMSTSRITISYSDPKKFTPPVYAEDSKTVPVQILVETKKPNGETTKATLSITRYRPSIDIKNEYTASYVTPSGFYCPGRVNRKPLPDIPQAFSVINQLARTLVESRDLAGVINHVGEEYDYNNKLFRFDTVNETEVHDFSTGLNYQVDKRTGECKIDYLKISIDSQPVSGVEGASLLEMRNPASFFGADGTDPQYVGQRYQNGLLCDVWVGRKIYFGAETVFEWYFLADDWLSLAGGKKNQHPVSTILYQPALNPAVPGQLTTAKTYNHWFLFSSQLVNILTFEIARCNIGIQRQAFMFTLPSSNAVVIRTHLFSFMQGTILAIQKVARVVILRVVDVIVEFGPGHVFVEFVVYDRSAKYGNVTLPTDDVVLDDATDNLIRYFEKNGLVITFETNDGKSVSVTSDKNIHRINKDDNSKFVVTIDGVYQGYDGGAVACFVIMMVLVGLSLGFLLILLHKRKTINLPFLRLFYKD